MDNYDEFIQERAGNLNCFHLFRGETRFKANDMACLEEPSFEDKLLRLERFKELSEKAYRAVEILFTDEDGVKFYSLFGREFRSMEEIMAEWGKDGARAIRKGLRLYLRKQEGFSIRDVHEVFAELEQFVAGL